MNATRQFKSMSLLILAQIMVGVNIVFSKVLLVSMPILFILTIRFTLAAVVLLPLHWLTLDRKIPIKVHFKKLNRRDWRFIIAQACSTCSGPKVQNT